MASRTKFSLLEYKNRFSGLAAETDQHTLARWAVDCSQRVLPYFEDSFPEDDRPQQALDTLRQWLATGEFRMKVIRQASLDSHAAARQVGADNPARSAARAAGQAVATAHVKDHAMGGAIYALQAIHRDSPPEEASEAVEAEYDWQVRHLQELRERANQ